jgi:hypothetical protein
LIEAAHARARCVDRERPTHAGDVPVQLVAVGEESEPLISAIADLVGILARREIAVLLADVDRHTVDAPLDVIRLLHPVALIEHVEPTVLRPPSVLRRW